MRELERVLRDAQERTLAGTAQAVATALHDRPRLFATPPDPIASFARERALDRASPASLPPSASPEIAQIIEGLSRTTARIWVIDRDGTVLARAGSLKPPPPQAPPESFWARATRATVGRLYPLVLEQPTDDFRDDAATQGAPHGRDVEGALAGILTTDRRRTTDGKAVIVSAAHPVWVGDQVRGAVIAEETGNAVLAERNRAFERLFNIVLAVLLVGSLALTAYATWLSSRIRRLRDDAERAIDEEGRVRAPLASSGAGDEIGDLSRSFSSRARPPGRVRELPGEDGEPAVARAAHADRGGALVARQPEGDAAADRRARVHGAGAGGARATDADPHAHDRGRAARADRCPTSSACGSISCRWWRAAWTGFASRIRTRASPTCRRRSRFRSTAPPT